MVFREMKKIHSIFQMRYGWIFLMCCSLSCGIRLNAQSLSIHHDESEGVRIEMNATPGLAYQLETSDDFSRWQDLLDPSAGLRSLSFSVDSFEGKFFRLRSWEMEEEDMVVAILGDSTVADWQVNQGWFYGWGQGLHAHFKPHVLSVNTAQPGQSSHRFFESVSLQSIQLFKPRFVIVAFGHVDALWSESDWGPGYYTELDAYEENLTAIANLVRDLGGIPIFLTPIPPRIFNEEGRIKHSMAERADVVKEVAKKTGSYLVDMNAISIAVFNELGAEGVAFTVHKGDTSHYTKQGADFMAGLVARELPEILRFHMLPVEGEVVVDDD